MSRRTDAIVVAGVGLVALGLVGWKGPAIASWWSAPHAVEVPTTPEPPLGSADRASRVRHDALLECRAKHWDTCEAELEWAKSLDPRGESAARVVEARAAIAAATGGDASVEPTHAR